MSRVDDWSAHREAERIAGTIRAQLGERAMKMMEATQLIALADGIKFKIAGCLHGNLLMIQVERDLYNVSLWSMRGAAVRCFDRKNGIGVEQLHATIEQVTGLYLSLGKRQ